MTDVVASHSSQKKQKQSQGIIKSTTSTNIKDLTSVTPANVAVSSSRSCQNYKGVFGDDILGKEGSRPITMFKEASKHVLADIKRKRRQADHDGGYNLADVVSQYLAKMIAEHVYGTDTAPPDPSRISVSQIHRNSKTALHRSRSTQGGQIGGDQPGNIPLDEWCTILREKQSYRRRQTLAHVETTV